MYFHEAGYFGMHLMWWLFWIFFWVSFLALLRPVRRGHFKQMRETPIDILQRRLAAGEITEHEYESRKSIIERDNRQNPSQVKASKIDSIEPLHT